MKKLFVVFAASLMTAMELCIADTLPYAEEFIQDGITWNYYTQDAPDYLQSKTNKCAYLMCRAISKLCDVVVPDEVDGLPVAYVCFGDNGCGNVNGYIRSVTFPSSIKDIKYLCNAATLKWVRMEESKIWHQVSFSFLNCTALTNAVVNSLPDSAFE